VNPYVFFVGCPRSGTTLLRRLGDAHSELAIIRELHWVPHWWERRVGITPDGEVTRELVQRLVAHPRFARLKVPAERVLGLLEQDGTKQYSGFVTALFDLHGHVRGKHYVGEKTPNYVRHLPTLNGLWPHAKVVHLIRDGRDVALSLIDWERSERNVGRFPTWEEDALTTAALFWEWNVRLGREARSRLDSDAYLELGYEALVADPELECRTLCEFLGLSYDSAMLRFHEGRTSSAPGLSAKRAWKPVTSGLRRWQEQMTRADVARFEAAAGELLEELGYERVAVSASDEELARAARLRERFADYARSCEWPVPRAWERVTA
jgi:Sulfotransferase family